MWIIFIIGMALIGAWAFKSMSEGNASRVDYSFFRQQLVEDNIKEVHFAGEIVTGKWKEIPKSLQEGVELKEEFSTVLPPTEDRGLISSLQEKGVMYKSEPTNVGIGGQLLVWMIGPLLIIAFFWFMMRRSSDPMGSGMFGNFAKSPAKRFEPADQVTTFSDVAAMEQAKNELEEIVEFLKNPARFQKLGAQIPKGVLLMGPPGTGKTLLARATAGEAGVPFFTISGSEFIQMFVGVGASRVRDLFRTAKENAPCMIFIDEIDAVGRVRGAGVGGGHDEREQTLNQILSEMDGFQQTDSVIVVAATNRPDVLDPALLRPGRFDRHVTIDRPTRKGRHEILKIHSRKVPLADDVDLERIADASVGFSGAQLKNLVNEAALTAAANDQKLVTADDFDNARDKIMMGPKREEILTERDKKMTACHEAGHALLSWVQPNADEVHRVTIIPRGRALGVTQMKVDEDYNSLGEKRLRAMLAYIMGGRAAEKIIFDEYSAGAQDDLKKATQIARKMVAHWGMSEVIGPVMYQQTEEHPFLGKEMHEHREYSEETARVIDQEVQRILTKASDQAMEMLNQHRDKLDRLTESLLEKETLDTDEITELIGVSAQAASLSTETD